MRGLVLLHFVFISHITIAGNIEGIGGTGKQLDPEGLGGTGMPHLDEQRPELELERPEMLDSLELERPELDVRPETEDVIDQGDAIPSMDNDSPAPKPDE